MIALGRKPGMGGVKRSGCRRCDSMRRRSRQSKSGRREIIRDRRRNPGKQESSRFSSNLKTVTIWLQLKNPPNLAEWIFKVNWSGRGDLNSRLLGPEPSALPGCATPRYQFWLNCQELALMETSGCFSLN